MVFFYYIKTLIDCEKFLDSFDNKILFKIIKFILNNEKVFYQFDVRDIIIIAGIQL